MKNLLMALFLGGAFFACVGDISNTLKTDHVYTMLTNDGQDTSKIWCRTARLENGSEVSTGNRSFLFTFRSSISPDTLLVLAPADCPDFKTYAASDFLTDLSDTLLYSIGGNVDEDFIDRIYLHSGDDIVDTLDVLDITTNYLRISFDEEGSSIEEIYQVNPSE